jgi:putative ABC transport system permease protein
MSWFPKSLFRPRWIQRSAVKQEIDEELRFHIEQRTAENIAGGMSPNEAAREACKRFGNMQSVREECRDVRGAAFSETVLQDIHFGLRLLRKNPVFTTVVLLTLALGIGAVAAVFSIVQGVLLKPSPYPKPEQIVLISPAKMTGECYDKGCSAEQLLEWRKDAKSFSAMAAYAWWQSVLLLPDGAEPMCQLVVDSDFFNVLGVQPQLGRVFQPSDIPTANASAGVVILGYDLWQRQFHGDPNIIGKVIHLNENSDNPALETVLGVMPMDLRVLPSVLGSHLPGYRADAHVDVWTLIAPPQNGANVRFKAPYWSVVGRLRDAAGLETAQAELTAIAARQAQDNPAFEGITAKLELLTTNMNGQARRLLVPYSGAVTLVFLIACGSVAGLLLARGLQRQREYAVRCALGAGRWRLARQSLVESLLVAISGGILGTALATAIVKVLKATAGAAIPRLDAVSVGWPTLSFCFAVTLLAAMIAGVVPAFRASRLNAGAAAKCGTRTGANRADRKLLGGVAMAQTALTLVLLVGAGLLIRTVVNLAQIRPGYDTERLVSMSVTELRQAQQASPPKDDGWWGRRLMDFHRRALAKLAGSPGVKNAAWAFGIPLTGNELPAAVQMSGYIDSEKFKDEIDIPVRAVSPEYFDTVGLQLLSGRNFGSSENFTNGMATIINEAMAKRYFGNTEPIGKKFRMAFRNSAVGIIRPFQDAQIIGVAANSSEAALTRKAEPAFYVSFWENPVPFAKSLVVRATGDPRSVIAGVQHALRAVDPAVAVEDVKTFEQIRTESIAPQLFTMRLLTAFSILAGALALIGIYGVLSLSVASRRQEMAVRMALGAPQRNVFGLIFGEGLKLVGVGVIAGAGVALASARILRALLFGVEPTDPLTFAAVAVLFLAVAGLSCYFPARRATQIDPMEALRYE